jgi:two-component system response regulator YesN
VAADIVVADMRMPGMDGTELLEAIHREFPDAKIVVMSGHDDFVYLRQAVKAKAVDYLIKPLEPVELNNILQQCVEEISSETSTPASMRTPVLFHDRTVLDEYVKHRRQVFANLLNLDSNGVRTTLKDLQNYLQSYTTNPLDDELSSRIVHDYILLLEEFVLRSQTVPDPTIFRDRNIDQCDKTEIFDALAIVFEEAIELIREAQRFKDYLDIEMVKEHIDHYFQEQISLESVAQMFLVSKEHLSRTFRKSEQVTVNEYITRKRMDSARYMIVNEGTEIKKAAILNGYSDLAYFYRVFKKYFGIAPGQIRQS